MSDEERIGQAVVNRSQLGMPNNPYNVIGYLAGMGDRGAASTAAQNYQTSVASPLGFSEATRGQDPMGPTGTISSSYTVPPAQKFIGDIINSLLFDERNAALPLAGVIRGLGPLRGRLLQPAGREMGGFNVPTSELIRKDPALKAFQDTHLPHNPTDGLELYNRLGFGPGEAREIAATRLPGPRQAHVDNVEDINSIARQMAGIDKSSLSRQDQLDFFSAYDKDLQRNIVDTIHAQKNLQAQRLGFSQN